MSQYDQTSDLKIFIGHCDLYFMVSDFALNLEDCLMFEHYTFNYIVIMSQCSAAFSLKQCRSQWFMFSWSIDFALYLK